MRLFLTGFMGAGKTATGQVLARRLEWPFFDLDSVVETQLGASITQIFEALGEERFRRAESDALGSLLASGQKTLVAALGGGAFTRPENQERLRQAGATTVFLDAPAEELHRRIRLQGQAALRPLFADLRRFRQMYAERRPYYLRADLRVETLHKLPEQVAAEIESWVKTGEGGGK